MRYITEKDAERHLSAAMEKCGSIDASGSVLGMRKIYGWPKGGQVRIGGYIYNIGPDEVGRARRLGILRGDT